MNTIQVTANTVRNALALARRELGIAAKTKPDTLSGDCGLYRAVFGEAIVEIKLERKKGTRAARRS